MNMPNGTIFIDVGEDPDVFGMQDPTGLRMQQGAHLPNLKIEQDAPSLPAAMGMDVGMQSMPLKSAQDLSLSSIKPELVLEESSSLINKQENSFNCPECPTFAAETEEEVESHIKTTHRAPNNAFTCFMCDFSTNDKKAFEDHARTHTGVKAFKCGHCDNRYTSLKNMKRHELVHLDENPNKCPDCSYIAPNRQAFATHRSEGCDQKRLLCPYCDFKTDKEKTLTKHKATHKLQKCTICSFETRSPRNFKLHKRSCSDKAKFKCSVCKWSSSHEPKILLHLIHHPKQDVKNIPVDLSILKKYGIIKKSK